LEDKMKDKNAWLTKHIEDMLDCPI